MINSSEKQSLYLANPSIASQWHPTKNGSFTPKDVLPGSGKKVWWFCRKGHEWEASINDRNRGRGCPYCAGQKASYENCLETVAPDIAKEWHPSKNGQLKPRNLTYGSTKKVWWICSKGHEWRATVNDRTSGQGCPYCAGKRVCSDNSLLTVNPVLANQWYTEKNRNLTPKDVTANSGKKVWWICKEGHVWCAAIYSRNKGSACPYCSGKKPDKRTCLKKINPLLAKEWHPMRNGSLTPKDVLPNSNKKVWWVCSRGHEWVAQINNRNKGRGCPECRSGTSQFELRVFCEMKHLFKQVHHRKKIFGVECDVYIPSIKVGIEIDSLYYHKGKYKQDVNKTNRLVKRGIRLMRIREAGLKPVSEDDIFCDKDTPDFSLLSKLIKKIYAEAEADEHVKRRLEHYLSQGRFANDKGYMDNLYKLPSPVDENSLAKCNKDLARQWHPTKNGSLTTRDVTPMSGLKIWWICDQGHEWDASVDKRSQGTGCPFCAGQKICDENSLFAVNPELAKEWHPTKNGSLTPDKIAPKARRTVWWVCSEGHEWAAAVYSRATGIGCPYCKGQRVCDDNSLMTINSKLAKEWHPTRNEGLTPRDVRPNSHKYVWWVCPEGHEWKAIIANRNKGKGCPFCSGKKSCSTNNLLVVNPTVANEWHPSKNGQLTPKDVTYGFAKKVWWMCTKGHEWQATVKHRNHGTGCPHCAGKMKGVTLSTSSLKI